MFATDRDLLVLEPHVFRDAAWVGQRLLSTTGAVSGTTLTLVSGDLNAIGAGAGSVIVYDAVPMEVISVGSATTATVSLVRSGTADPAIPPPALGTKPVTAWTFRPQISLVHAQVLRMLGIEPGDTGAMVREASIVNPGALTLVESLGALHLIFSAAAALSGADSSQANRAEVYRRRFSEERQRAVARIDLDGDGVADATRRLNLLQFIRG